MVHAPPLRRRMLAAVALAAAFTALAFPVAVPERAHAAEATLAVDPASGLADQVVKVSWTGFPPTDASGFFYVTVMQCKAGPKSLKDCYTELKPPNGGADGSAVADAVTKADGTGSTFLEVRPTANLPQLDCSSHKPCSVLAFANDGNVVPEDQLPATAVTAPLEFGRSPSDCPEVPVPDVVTEGEASTAHALYTWAAQTCTAKPALSVDYTELSSQAGTRDFLSGELDVGLTSAPAGPQDLAEAPGHRSFTYAPVDLTGVVVAFNVTDTVTGERITEMNLTPRLLAILIAGWYDGGPGTHLFQDPEFVAANPGHNWPSFTHPPLVRSEKNADALLVTGWLQADPAARAFLDGNDPDAAVDPGWKGVPYPADSFEARDPATLGTYNPRNGTLANARRLFNFQAPGDGVFTSVGNDGILGIMDAVAARQFGFPTAKLRRAKGTAADPFVAADEAGMTAGYAAMKPNPDGVTATTNPTAANAYPLVKADYAMVPTSGVDAAKAAKIARFLDFAAGPGQAPEVLGRGYLPLTSDLKAKVAAAKAAVLAPFQPKPNPKPGPARPQGPASPGPSGSESTGVPFDPSSAAEGNATVDGGGSTAGGQAAVGRTDGRTAATPTTSSRDRTRNGVFTPVARVLGTSRERLVLPVLLGLGLVAVAVGPGLAVRSQLRSRRSPKGPSSSA